MRLFSFFLFVPILMNAHDPDSRVVECVNEQRSISSYLKDLEEQGYCIIPEIFSKTETELLYQRVWHEFIEKAWPNCKMDDNSNWKETFPIHNKFGIFAGPAGQIQVMWDLRQDSRIVEVFAQIWNTNDLIVSMDGLSIMCPPEIREGPFKPWPHVDQKIFRQQDRVEYDGTPPIDFVSESSLKTKPYTIQGQFLFQDSFEGDGGFYCIPKSHLRFSEFAPQLEAFDPEKWNTKYDYLCNFFGKGTDESGEPYCMKHVTAPRGSLILWDSRTVHWNQHPRKDRPHNENLKVRMVGYLSYEPKSRLTDKGKALRQQAFEMGVSTGHISAYPQLKYTKEHMQPEFMDYLEDANYIQPKINLTPLGESLLY